MKSTSLVTLTFSYGLLDASALGRPGPRVLLGSFGISWLTERLEVFGHLASATLEHHFSCVK